MRSAARWVLACACVVLVAGATVGLVLHEHSSARPADSRSQLEQDGRRLRDIHTLLQGSALAPSRAVCAWYAHIDATRTGRRYPPAGSSDWNYLLSACHDGSGS